MNRITNRQAICDTLVEAAKSDKDIVVLCSDSRGSASLKPFFEQYPGQSVEVGIAEQNLVTIAAGLASCGKKAFAVSPASFISTRSYEQAKVDVAYSGTNVTLVGISGGVSYGALGMTHHSCQDIAALSALPGMRVYLPSDRFQTSALIKALLEDREPAYIRVSRSATEDVYDSSVGVDLNKAMVLREGADVLIVACGDMVPNALRAAGLLGEQGIRAGVIDMYCLKPFDKRTLLKYACSAGLVVTVEEHSPYGGLGSITAMALAESCPKRMLQIALPDGHIIAGTNQEVFGYYGMDGEGIAGKIRAVLTEV